MKARVVIALGANLGEKEKTIKKAQKQIGKLRGVVTLAHSRHYRSKAVTENGVDEDQPEYVNAVTIVETKLSAKKLLSRLNDIENNFGRVRLARWAPRTLDLDIITYGTSLIETNSLVVPHPRAFQRAFVLIPWLELDPEAVLPGMGLVREIARDMADQVTVLS